MKLPSKEVLSKVSGKEVYKNRGTDEYEYEYLETYSNKE